jgi:hypothetical protein
MMVYVCCDGRGRVVDLLGHRLLACYKQRWALVCSSVFGTVYQELRHAEDTTVHWSA